MKHLYIFLLYLIVPAIPVLAAERFETVIEDQAETDLLLGKHLFTDSELATVGITSFYQTFGTAKISHNGNFYQFKAETECYQREPYRPDLPKGGYSRLEGNIVNISPDSFTVHGTLDVFYLPNTGPNTKWDNKEDFKCQVAQAFLFSKKGHPGYWRMQTEKPSIAYEEARPLNGDECLSYIGAIDIFVKPLENPAPYTDCVRNIKDFPTLPHPLQNH
jgi:hypothetical protein